ncbi:MAG: tetratricopeptide repeat protein [Synechococcales cyanobacterium C42_A2020_086]|nr:tetratricopeptide repeat protein [Synechococcales cyanobacterium C42_A2020_086]
MNITLEKQPSRRAGGKSWRLFWLGVPLVSLGLWLSRSDVPMRLQAWRSRTFSPLEAPYRYPFLDSRSGNSDPAVAIQQQIAHFQARVRQHPESGLEQAALAAAYFKMGRTTGEGNWYLLAEQTAQQSWAKLPFENTEALAVLARVAEARHDFPTALRLASDLKPEDAASLRITANLAMGNLAAAHQAATELVDLTLSFNAFMLLAMVQQAQGDNEAALQSFRHALEVEEAGDLSNSARLRTLLGRFFAEQGDLSQAQAFYQEALQILPHYPLALLNLAQLELRQDNLATAERYYAQLSRTGSSPYLPLIRRGQAQIQYRRGNTQAANARWSEAEMLLRQTAAAGDATFGHQRDLARLLLERGRSQDRAEALALMQTEVTIRRDASTLDTYAWALASNGRWLEAQQVIQEALALGSRDAALVYRASTIEQALGNSSSAQAYLQRAWMIDPQLNEQAIATQHLSVGLGE